LIAADAAAMARGENADPQEIMRGVLNPNSVIIFEKKEGSSLFLTGKAKVSTFCLLE